MPLQAVSFTSGVKLWACPCKLPAPGACVCALALKAVKPSTSAAAVIVRNIFRMSPFSSIVMETTMERSNGTLPRLGTPWQLPL